MIFTTSSPDWQLDSQLAHDTVVIGEMPLCRALLMKDATYPWLLLVPRRPQAVEIADLDTADQTQLIGEVAHVSGTLKALTSCDKINIAALGNVVSQLHVHVIGRSRGDAAWPNPVWNAVPPRSYDNAVMDELIAGLRKRIVLRPV
jgi:diadenosine tetraphosphate (Ap4A) HIT family hydrolase